MMVTAQIETDFCGAAEVAVLLAHQFAAAVAALPLVSVDWVVSTLTANCCWASALTRPHTAGGLRRVGAFAKMNYWPSPCCAWGRMNWVWPQIFAGKCCAKPT